ncbi:hypothetical protein BC936DRAFT_141043, partial [Jimgerdemannia flammicorona]
IVSGHISILRTINPSVTFPTIQVAVYYSGNIYPSDIRNTINNDTGTYHHTLFTPTYIQPSQRLTVCWTVVLPYAWARAKMLKINVQNSRVDIVRLSFQEAWINTTNAEIEILGLTAASVRLEAKNSQIQGNVIANHELTVQAYNSLVNLVSRNPTAEKIVVRATNGTVLGKYLAKNVMVETVRGQVSIQAEAEEVTVNNTDGPIGGSYRVAKALTLKTTNGLVDVDAGIFGSYSVAKTLKLETTNALVNVAAEAEETTEKIVVRAMNGTILGRYRAKNIMVETVRGHVNIKAEAEGVTVNNTDGPIGGSYRVVKALALKTTNGLVDVDAKAEDVDVRTTNGGIFGSYNVAKTLKLETTNALVNVAAEAEEATEKIVVRAMNGTILGKYLAKNIMVETVRGHVSIQAEAEGVTVNNTDGPIGGSYRVVKALTLKTTNGLVDADAKAENVEVRTTNGAISGSYHAAEILKLVTTDALVRVAAEAGEVQVQTTKGAIYGDYAIGYSLAMETSYEEIQANVTFLNRTRYPVVSASTTNEKVYLSLPANFSGHFDVRSLDYTSYVNVRDECNQGDIVFEINNGYIMIGTKGTYYPGGQVVMRSNWGGGVDLVFV